MIDRPLIGLFVPFALRFVSGRELNNYKKTQSDFTNSCSSHKICLLYSITIIYNHRQVSYYSTISHLSLRLCVVPLIARLKLPAQQVRDHFAAGDSRRGPQGREVKGAGESIGVTEEKHGRDPTTGVLEGKARLLHLVLLDLAAAEVVDGARGVDLRLKSARNESDLSSLKDVEVVIGGVAAGVALGANRGA